MHFIKNISLLLVALFLTSTFAFAQNSTTTTVTETVYHAEASEAEAIVKTVDIKVKGVGCNTDIKTISTNVEKLDGVSSCKVAKKGATTTFKVTLNAAVVTEEDVYAAIENTAGCKNPNDRPYKVKL